MANYPVDNIMTEKEVITPYRSAFYTAHEVRFGAPVEEAYAVAPQAAPAEVKAKCCGGYKKNSAIITIVGILSLLVVAVAAISYIGIASIAKYTAIFGGKGIESTIENAINLFKDGSAEILDYIVPLGILASVVVAFCIFISAIAGLASKGRILFWLAALVALLLAAASAVVYYLSFTSVDLVDFITPGGDYLGIGFIAILGLEFITLILACFANKKA